MKNRQVSAPFLVLTFLVCSVAAHAAGWSLYFTSKDGTKFFLDRESIHSPPEGNMVVMEKVESKERAQFLTAVDCERKRFKTLRGEIFHGGDVTVMSPSGEWAPVTTDPRHSALSKEICGKK